MSPRINDDDTDPEGPSRSGSFRLPPSTPEEGALSNAAKGSWQMLILIGSILTGTAAVLIVDTSRATTVAREVVAPVEKKLDDHVLGLAGKRELMDTYTRQQAEIVREIRADAAETKKMIRALCRASARPAVCLGGE